MALDALRAYASETCWGEIPNLPQEAPHPKPAPAHLQAAAIKAEIMKGLAMGDTPQHLLLQAAKAIALLTNDTQFYAQVDRDVKEKTWCTETVEKPLNYFKTDRESYKAIQLRIFEAQAKVKKRIEEGENLGVLFLAAHEGLDSDRIEDYHYNCKVQEYLQSTDEGKAVLERMYLIEKIKYMGWDIYTSLSHCYTRPEFIPSEPYEIAYWFNDDRPDPDSDMEKVTVWDLCQTELMKRSLNCSDHCKKLRNFLKDDPSILENVKFITIDFSPWLERLKEMDVEKTEHHKHTESERDFVDRVIIPYLTERIDFDLPTIKLGKWLFQ